MCDASILLKSINFSAEKHKNQRRKSKEQTPYINHPIGVAHILMFEGDIQDTNTLVGAVLHDTVEDTDTTLDEITALFGSQVAKIVSEVTDDKSLPKLERKRLQIEHAPHISKEAKLVKLADKIYNLRDLLVSVPVGWEQQRVDEYFAWAKQVTDGLRGVNPKLDAILDDIYILAGSQDRAE
ncbi:guanosine-3',5'-bis 3'-pyrophosphohydrolase MESH1-like protein [Gorgonomyces haynaldii]|nr:guanosine-3',5'-bis 3'-pyrophosphohydrolase MESH1-like protein [Gorgonomyces haynaldii]